MTRAIIFDYDGVLVETEPLHYAALARVVPEFGLSLDARDFWSQHVGLADAEIIERLAAAAGLALAPARLADIRRAKDRAFEELVAGGAPLLPGARAFVLAAARRVPLAVCSGARRVEIERTLAAAGLSDVLRDIVAVEDVARTKPDPEGYRKARALLAARRGDGLPADRCIAIEDSVHGVRAAAAAGMRVIAFRKPYAAEAARQAHAAVDGFGDLDLDALLSGA